MEAIHEKYGRPRRYCDVMTMRKFVKVDVTESLVRRMRKRQDVVVSNTGSVEGYVDAAVREKLERDRRIDRCPRCGEGAILQVGTADDVECQSCGWMSSEGLGGRGFDWTAWRDAEDGDEDTA